MGVTSLIDLTSMPAACRARMADSRPAPGPLTSTSTERSPRSLAVLPAACAATWAANGVPLREPLKPMRPADDHASTFPSGSASETIVLLKVAWMCATPWGTIRFSFFLPAFFSPGFAIDVPLLLHCLLFARHGAAARAFAGAGVGLRALAAHRQVLAVPDAAVAADLHQPLDVLADLLAQVALDAPFVLDHLADPARLVLGEVPHLGGRRHPRLGEDRLCARAPDAVDVRQPDPDLLVLGEVHSCDPCHIRLPLTLLVFGVLADHPHDALPADDLALGTDPPDR